MKKRKENEFELTQKPNNTWERYGAMTPNEFPEKKKQCQRCIDAGNRHCDVDAFLGYGCSFCDVPPENRGGTGKGKRRRTPGEQPPEDGAIWESHECQLPESNIKLRRRPNLRRSIKKWYRHACPGCVKALKEAKTSAKQKALEPCSWLLNRTNKRSSCEQCIIAGIPCEGDVGQDIFRTPFGTEPVNTNDETGSENGPEDNEAGENESVDNERNRSVEFNASQPPRTWKLPYQRPKGSLFLGQKPTHKEGNVQRSACPHCEDADGHCTINPNEAWSACYRCQEMGIDCIDFEENLWPIGNLAKVGFGHFTPYPMCQPCADQGLNCDRQTPCDSCLAAGRGHNECRPGLNKDYRNCLAGRLEPAPGPLYYLALGYGAGGVNTRKTMTQLEDWIGPPEPCHGRNVNGPDVDEKHRGNYKFPSQCEGKASTKRNETGNHPPEDQAEPPLMRWKPASAMTVEDIRIAIQLGWENALAPAEYKKQLLGLGVRIRPQRRKRKADTQETTSKRQKSSFGFLIPPPVPVAVPAVPAAAPTTTRTPSLVTFSHVTPPIVPTVPAAAPTATRGPVLGTSRPPAPRTPLPTASPNAPTQPEKKRRRKRKAPTEGDTTEGEELVPAKKPRRKRVKTTTSTTSAAAPHASILPAIQERVGQSPANPMPPPYIQHTGQQSMSNAGYWQLSHPYQQPVSRGTATGFPPTPRSEQSSLVMNLGNVNLSQDSTQQISDAEAIEQQLAYLRQANFSNYNPYQYGNPWQGYYYPTGQPQVYTPTQQQYAHTGQQPFYQPTGIQYNNPGQVYTNQGPTQHLHMQYPVPDENIDPNLPVYYPAQTETFDPHRQGPFAPNLAAQDLSARREEEDDEMPDE